MLFARRKCEDEYRISPTVVRSRVLREPYFNRGVRVKNQVLSCNMIRWFRPHPLKSQPQPAEWLDGRADTRSRNLNKGATGLGWAHNWSYYLCCSVCECRHVVSNVLKLDRWSLPLLWHKCHIQFLTSAPNFRWSVSWSPDPAFRAPVSLP